MDGHYRKRGSIARYENGALVLAREEGEARVESERFRCAPIDAEPLPQVDPAGVHDVVRRVEDAVRAPLSIERLIVIDGMAEHQTVSRTWSDVSRRVHLSIAHGARRVLVDEGSFDFVLDDVVEALPRIGSERPCPPRIRVAPRVMAALTPSLLTAVPPNLEIEQVAGGHDGVGNPVLRSVAPDWPNVYRPSYRVRPRRAPMNVAVRCAVTEVEKGLPRAVALLAPVHGLTMRILCVDGAAVFPATARAVRIDAVASPARWFPFDGGVWAGEAEIVTGAQR